MGSFPLDVSLVHSGRPHLGLALRVNSEMWSIALFQGVWSMPSVREHGERQPAGYKWINKSGFHRQARKWACVKI